MTEQKLSNEERKRLLKERRQAKMANGKASNRLNTILSQGSQMEAHAVSVLDSKEDPPISQLDSQATNVKPEEDPGIADIEEVIGTGRSDDDNEQEIDKMLSNVLHRNSSNNGGENDEISRIMESLMGQQTRPDFQMQESKEELEYAEQLRGYRLQQKKHLKASLLIFRYLAIIVNFFYHYHKAEGLAFQPSQDYYIRGYPPLSSNGEFFLWFTTIEVVSLAFLYFQSVTKPEIFNISDDSFILKGLSFASSLVPNLQDYQPIVTRLLTVWDLVSTIFSDLSLVVVLFGLCTFL